MSLPALIIFALILLFIEIHTVSYAVWNWKNKNKMGSITVILLCITAAVLPVYMAFFST